MPLAACFCTCIFLSLIELFLFSAGGQRKDDSSSWRNMINIVLPVVICVIVLVCLIVGIVIWICYRKRYCCCAGSATSSRDPEQPNTRTEVKRVDPDAKEDLSDMHDIKRCRASTSNVKTTTPDIIINFVPSRPSHKNINSEQGSRSKKGKELDSPLENTR